MGNLALMISIRSADCLIIYFTWFKQFSIINGVLKKIRCSVESGSYKLNFLSDWRSGVWANFLLSFLNESLGRNFSSPERKLSSL